MRSVVSKLLTFIIYRQTNKQTRAKHMSLKLVGGGNYLLSFAVTPSMVFDIKHMRTISTFHIYFSSNDGSLLCSCQKPLHERLEKTVTLLLVDTKP